MRTEEELVIGAQKGDHDSFEELVILHRTTIYNLLLGIVPNVAEDITQEAFMRAFSHIRSFQFRSSFKTWLTRIAINQAKNYLRKQKIREIFLGHSEQTDGSESARIYPQTEIENVETVSEIKGALRSLSYSHREILVLHDILGYDYEESAATLGISLGTVKSRLFYARRALKAKIGVERGPYGEMSTKG